MELHNQPENSDDCPAYLGFSPFQTENRPSKLLKLFGSQKKRLSIESMQKIEDILEAIQGTDCAACGAPDCRTFAEDIVRGNAKMKDCLWVRAQGKKKTGSLSGQ